MSVYSIAQELMATGNQENENDLERKTISGIRKRYKYEGGQNE